VFDGGHGAGTKADFLPQIQQSRPGESFSDSWWASRA